MILPAVNHFACPSRNPILLPPLWRVYFFRTKRLVFACSNSAAEAPHPWVQEQLAQSAAHPSEAPGERRQPSA